VPAGVSAYADGYAFYAEVRIVLVTSTSAFTKAQGARDRCGNVEAIREIAGAARSSTKSCERSRR
jgi:hypothetical protein